MKFIIIGCGRMGAGLARMLIQRGHTVTVVDRDPTAFERLGITFKGQTVVGVGFDRDVLVQAGIERADGLAAVTVSDEVNIVTARLASMVFRVPRVFARLYDPRKAEIYQRLGLQTIAPVAWAISQAADLLSYSELDTVFSLGSGEVNLIEVEAPPLLVGRTTRDLTVLGEVHVVTVTRGSRTFLPTMGTQFEAGDLIHLAVATASIEQVRALLGLS